MAEPFSDIIALGQFDFMFLFETTGLAAIPFTQRGYRTLIVDLANNGENPLATKALNWNILEHEEELFLLAQNCRFVFGMPPCTDVAGSGSAHFAKKLATNANVHYDSLWLVQSVVRIAGSRPWCIENPVGLLSTIWRKPDYIFDPCEFGGYLPNDDKHPLWPDFIPEQDAYPKKTCLWYGNGFEVPRTKYIMPYVGYSKQHRKLGGKSDKTKRIRSASPRGFFTALAVMYHGD